MTSISWEEFEKQCTEYLKQTFGTLATFIHQGGADSTVPDILVTKSDTTKFYIEAKHTPAQCGQFVLLPNIESGTFEYSNQNKSEVNEYSQIIIEHMNNNFNSFCEAGTTGQDIVIQNSQEVFSNWIIKAYREKNVKFFITDNFTILPIEDFQKHFKVSAKYRIKRSGSNNIGRNRIKLVSDYISSKEDYGIMEITEVKDKLFVTSTKELDTTRFILIDNEYMFSTREDKFEIRKLSNTYNANVIFSIEKIQSAQGLTSEQFSTILK